MNQLYNLFQEVLEWCDSICGNFLVAIVFFTFLSKIILLPVTIWVQKNSIKLVKMTSEINRIKIKYFGDRDTIAEEEQKIYKTNGYNPFASIIPMFIQIFLLIILIGTIHQVIDQAVVDLIVWKIDLAAIPYQIKGSYYIAPILAGLSAYLLSISQNHANILQSEQTKGMQYGTMLLSVGLSLYLGFFVQIAIVVYWISSNLLSIVQQYVLNCFINPKKYVDFEELNETKEQLKQLDVLGEATKAGISKEEIKREKADYKRFFSIVNKHLVFYSESSGFYKYFQGIIEYLLEHTNITIHYITSDPYDQIFEIAKEHTKIKPYFIAEKRLITLMMKLDTDIMIMTMPDLDNYHIKRSYVRDDIEYIFIPHSMCSLNLTMRKGSMDHYDTLFCSGIHQKEEAEKTGVAYNLPERKLVEWGYCLLDTMREQYTKLTIEKKSELIGKTILIAPSWQEGNIIDSCMDEMLDSLCGKGYRVIVRPHPQHVKHQPERMEYLKERFNNNKDIEIQTDFSSNDTVFLADMMITDWSGIAYEYSFTTYKPVIFVDTPLKIMNPEYQMIDTEPFNIWVREKIGKIVQTEDVMNIDKVVDQIIDEIESYKYNIEILAKEYVYNLDNSAEVGAKYIINSLKKKIEEKKNVASQS